MNGQNGDSRGQDQKSHAEAQQPRTAMTAPFARLKKRSEFLAVGKGARMHEAAFTLQATEDANRSEPARRFGLTVTKKTGNSVARNRIRRRLREALRTSGLGRGDLADGAARDYVIVARRETLARDFTALQTDLAKAIARIDRKLAARTRDASAAQTK